MFFNNFGSNKNNFPFFQKWKYRKTFVNTPFYLISSHKKAPFTMNNNILSSYKSIK